MKSLKKKEALKKEQNAILNNKVSFFGNELLINSYKELELNYSDSKYVSNKNFNFTTLKEAIQKEKDNNTLTHKIVFLFDSSFKVKSTDWDELLSICTDNEIFIISTSTDTTEIINQKNQENITLIDFSNKISENKEYLMSDKIHLTSNGISVLISELKEYL